MSDYKEGGVKMKYLMFRADGTPLNKDACYFVLRLDKDPHAKIAAAAYADSIEVENSELSDNIKECLDELSITSADCTCGGRGETYCRFHDAPILGSKVWRYGESIKPSYSKLESELSASQAREAELREKLEFMTSDRDSESRWASEYKQRAEAAEAKLKEIYKAPVVATAYTSLISGVFVMRTRYGENALNTGDELIIRQTIKE